MEYSFPHYLLSKQSVDDRALNRTVIDSLKANLPASPIQIIEVGAGIGTMLTRLLRWELVAKTNYILVDEMSENIQTAREWIPLWAVESGWAWKGSSRINFGFMTRLAMSASALSVQISSISLNKIKSLRIY
jgi:hypothetical protein